MTQQKTSPVPSSPAVVAGKNPVNVVSAPPTARKPAPKKVLNVASIPFWLGLLISIMWVGIVLLIVAESGPAHTFAGLPLVNWAIGISAIASPVALVWMVTAYLQRAADIQTIAEPLRRQLSMITGESGIAEARIRRFNQAIREQVALLKEMQASSRGDFADVVARVHKSRLELEQFENSSIQQVREIQEIIRRNMQQVEQLMDDKFTMMRVLDDKLVQSGDTVARHTDSVRDQISKLLEDVEANSSQLSAALDHAVSDSKKLSDTSKAQEASLLSAAENAAEILNGVSSKIDLSIARFLERAGTARGEAERLAGALDVQTRTLDEFSSTLPARVSETEVILRGVADRLYDSEKMAREQAVGLTEGLAQQVDNLHEFMDQFASRMTGIDSALDKRHSDLHDLAERVAGSATEFTSAWEKSVGDLTSRSDESLLRFSSVNDETRKNADALSAHLAETTAKYEDAAMRMRAMTEQGHADLKGVTEQIDAQLKQFDMLREASHKMGLEVEARATAAMQNLQAVLERLTAAREATQSVGENLVRDLSSAVDQNETLMSRLNDAAQMSVRALGIATETLGKQEGAMITQTRGAEQTLRDVAADLQVKAESAVHSLREQTSALTGLLAQAQIEMDKTDNKIQQFVAKAMPPVQETIRQIDGATDQGLRSLEHYGSGLQQQLSRLQDYNANVGGMGDDLVRITAETVATIEQMQNRFASVRATQEDAARQTLLQFADFADRLQREVSGLDGNAAQAVASLQNAATKVGEQSYQMLQTAENSGAKIQLITAALQGEATQIRATLQKQSDDLATDLARAEKQFTMLGEAIQQRSEAAYSMLDRVATHYNEATSAAAQNLEARTDRLSEVTGQVQGKVESLTNVLGQQLTQLGSGSTQLESHAAQITGASSKALQQLTAVNEKLALTHESSSRSAQQTIARLEEVGNAFMRQSNNLSDVAQNSTNLVQKSGSAFGEQASKMLDQTRMAEQQLRQLAATTSTTAEQAAQIRSGMEQHNQRLVTQLTEAVAILEATNNKMQQTASSAVANADQVAARFNDVTDNADRRLGASNQNMQDAAGKAEIALSTIGASITQQAASLAILGEQMTEQQRAMSTANDAQRIQLIELFDKLGTAHGQASEVAERTITRLTDSLNQIQRQLGALSDQSQTTVGNVRTASDGFAEQNSLLIQNAQQAEQQARTVLSVTSALSDQARQLREALHGEGERAGDILGGLVSKLSSGGIQLREMSSTTEMSLTSLHNSVEQQAQGLNATMQSIADRQRSLTSALDAQRDVLNGLLSRLVLAQDETASVAERTSNRITDGTQQIARQMESMEQQAKSTIVSVQAINSTFVDESHALSTYAREAEQQVRSVQSTTIAMAEQTRQARESLQNETDRAAELLSGLVNRMVQSGGQVRDMANATESALVGLQSGLAEQSGEIGSIMQQIIERQKVLTTALFEQREVMTALLNRINTAQDETANTAERTVVRFADSTQNIARSIEALDTQIKSALENIEIASSSFVQESNVLNAHAREAEQQARSVAASAVGLQEQTRQVREAMQSEGERAGAIFTDLVGKLLHSGNHVREITASTEAAMAGLNSGITQQSSDITEAMAHIVDRQKVLTAALAEQRDMMTSLLTRVSAAQDESAAAAERTVVRLSDGAQHIVKQLESIGEHAQGALHNVQAAGRSFADEAGNLNIHAQQAEQHVRSVVNVMGSLQDQAQKVRENLHADTARVISDISGVISHIDGSVHQVKEQSGQAVHALNQSAQHFSLLAQSSADALQHHVETLVEVKERSETSMNEAGDRVKHQIKLITDIGAQAEMQARQLADVAEYASNRLGALRGTIVEADNDGQSALHKASTRIESVRGELHTELQRLVELSRVTIGDVTAASQNLALQSDTLRANLANSESALVEAATLIRDETIQIPAKLDRSTAQIEAAARALKMQADEADSTLIGTADRFIGVTMTARESMVDEMRRINAVADDAGKTLQQFTVALAEQVAAMQMSAGSLSGEQRTMVAKAEQSVEQLLAASDRMAQLRSDTGATAEKLAHEFAIIDKHATAASERLERAGEATIKNVEAITEATQRAEAQMLGATNGFRDQLERIRAGLQGQIEDINRGLMQITAQLERTGSTLRSTTAGTVADVERISQRFNETSNDASIQLSEKTARMRGATEDVAKLLSGFGDQLDVLLDRLSMAGDGIKRQEGSLVGQLQAALGHLSTVAERLEDGRNLASAVSQEAASHLSVVVDEMQKQMQVLTSGSQTATGIMRGIGQIYSEQTQGLNKGVVEAHGQVQVMNKAIDDMQQRTDRMRVALKLQGEELMDSLQQILSQLSVTGDALSHTVDSVLQEKATENLKKMG